MSGFSFGAVARRPLRVLCLGAHSDDIEIGCGATVMRLIESVPDAAFRWVVFSGDDTRQKEARASAADYLQSLTDKEVTLFRFRESFFFECKADIKQEFERLKASFSPTLILSHCKDDAHQDHQVIADLTWNTFRDHAIWEYEIPKYEGDVGNPNLFVPFEQRLAERKVTALMRHFRSQHNRAWFAPATFMAMMTLRGIHCNAPAGLAEAFTCRKMVV